MPWSSPASRGARSRSRRPRPGAPRSRARNYVRLASRSRWRRRQDRGHRVLLVRLPALQRVRADARAWLKKLPPDVAFRRVPVAFSDEPFVAHQKHLLCARGDGPGPDRCTARSSTPSTASTSGWTSRTRSPPSWRRTASTAPSSSTPTTPSGCRPRRARRAAGAGIQDRWGAGDGRAGPLLHQRHDGRHNDRMTAVVDALLERIRKGAA